MTWDHFTVVFDEYWASITFIVATIFVLYYGFAAPWYKTPFGQALIVVDLGLAVATFPTALEFLFGYDLSYNRILEAVTIVIASFVPLAIAYRTFTLWKIRNTKFWQNFNNGKVNTSGAKPEPEEEQENIAE